MFKNFAKRLERDLKRRTKDRHAAILARHPNSDTKANEVNVVTHPFQRYAVWFGGSMLASQPEFLTRFHTKAQYEEEGPRIARSNAAFSNL